MKIERVIRHFKTAPDCFCCPKCKEPAHLTDKSYICPNGHCYDLSAKNYVNFAPAAKATKYNAALFEARHAILNDGFYEPVLQALFNLIGQSHSKESIIDAGCGEGYYAGQIHRHFPDTAVFAMDLSKDAILSATRHYPELFAVIGDLTRLPFQNHSADLILNILTPASYQEFFRVLKPGGLLIKVIPGSHYLKEIREALKGQLHQPDFSNQQVLDHIRNHAQIIDHQVLNYTLPVSEAQRAHFITMTPMTFNLDDKTSLKADFNTITIHLEILVCQNPST